MRDILIFVVASFFEIFGCFAFWSYFKLNKSAYWLMPGVVSLMLFAYVLTRADNEFAGRAYAIYGGIYIVASLAWLYFVENSTPDKWDIIGALICVSGAMVILFMPR